MTDVELLVDLQRRFEESGDVPFSIEEGALIEKLSFTARSLTIENFRGAWTGFLAEIGLDTLGWPVHFGILHFGTRTTRCFFTQRLFLSISIVM